MVNLSRLRNRVRERNVVLQVCAKAHARALFERRLAQNVARVLAARVNGRRAEVRGRALFERADAEIKQRAGSRIYWRYSTRWQQLANDCAS